MNEYKSDFGINHSIHLLFGWPEVSGVSKSTSSACPGSCHCRITNVSFFEFAVVNLLGLRTILVLPLTRFLLLKLYWQVATTVLPSRACRFAHLDQDLYSKCSCPRTICKFGTASYQMPSSKLVVNGDCAVQKSDAAKL